MAIRADCLQVLLHVVGAISIPMMKFKLNLVDGNEPAPLTGVLQMTITKSLHRTWCTGVRTPSLDPGCCYTAPGLLAVGLFALPLHCGWATLRTDSSPSSRIDLSKSVHTCSVKARGLTSERPSRWTAERASIAQPMTTTPDSRSVRQEKLYQKGRILLNVPRGKDRARGSKSSQV
jgi:hypothetical protein